MERDEILIYTTTWIDTDNIFKGDKPDIERQILYDSSIYTPFI